MENRKKKFIRELCEKSRVRKESGLFVVDGPKMCGEIPSALAEEIYVTEEFLASPHVNICERILREHPFETVTTQDMQKMSDTVTPQGILAVVRQKRAKTVKELLDTEEEPLLLITETIQDPGNLGTMIRAAEAAGATGILMNDMTVDPYSPKVVRSTMGSIFRVPFAVVSDLSRAVKDMASGVYGNGPVNVVATDLSAAKSYREVDYRKPTAILIGNESKGLSGEIKELSTERVIIPMCGKVESLNAAMAATILMFEASGERRRHG